MSLPASRTEIDVDDCIDTLKELWITDSDLSFLRTLEPASLGLLTLEVKAHHERTEAGQRAIYEALAKATRFIPNFLLQKIASGLSPYVQARITERLEPKAAAALSKPMEAQVLAEIALHLDARFAAQIAAYQPLDTLIEITLTMMKKGLARKLAEISDSLEEPVLEKVIARIVDAEQLAAVAGHMTALAKLKKLAPRLDKSRRTTVIGLLSSRGQHEAAAALAL